ncbi:MAG TPA: hypothetical protein VGQ98_00080 [Gemmatimonadaceae bacterium]|nr:hypothetical protein [Gemmatimonadaceae bacterium]
MTETSPMADTSHRSLWVLLKQEAIALVFRFPGSVVLGVPALILFCVLSVPRFGAIGPLVLLGAIAILVRWLVQRARILRQLCQIGVEVEAELVNETDSSAGDTDFRTATYRYEYAGRNHSLELTTTDFFTGLATRHGERVVLLIDPTQPWVAVVLKRAVGLSKQ